MTMEAYYKMRIEHLEERLDRLIVYTEKAAKGVWNSNEYYEEAKRALSEYDLLADRHEKDEDAL